MQPSTCGARRAWLCALASAIGLISSLAHAEPGDRLTRFPFPVTPPEGTQQTPDLAMSGDGSFVVAWYRQLGIQVRRFDADGTPRGPERIVAPHLKEPRKFGGPYVAMARDGRFVVVWSTYNRGMSVYARLYAANGAPRSDAILVDTDAFTRARFSVAMGATSGRFTVAYLKRTPTGGSLFVRMYAADGTPLTAPLDVLPNLPANIVPGSPVAAADANGNAVVAWRYGMGLHAQRFTAAGAPVGPEMTLAGPIGNQEVEVDNYAIARSASGDFVATWQRVYYDDQWIETGVFARHFAPDGTPRRAEQLVSQGLGYAHRLDVAMDASNRYVVTWMGPAGVAVAGVLHTRLYRSNGTAVTDDEAFGFDDVELDASSRVAIDDRSNFVAIVRRASGSPGSLIIGQRFAGVYDTSPSCSRFVATRVGTSGADTLHGGPDGDVIVGLGGDDRINGWGGADVICGGSGADVIYAGSGADYVSGGSGDDVLDGGDGVDVCDGGNQTNADTAVQCEAVTNVP
jgi:hypothetical protein